MADDTAQIDLLIGQMWELEHHRFKIICGAGNCRGVAYIYAPRNVRHRDHGEAARRWAAAWFAAHGWSVRDGWVACPRYTRYAKPVSPALCT